MEPIPYVHFSYGIIEKKERRKNNTEHCMHKETSIHTRTLNYFFFRQWPTLVIDYRKENQINFSFIEGHFL